MRQFNLLALSAVLLLSTSAAQAHRQWLLPSATQLDGKEAWVTIDGAVSEDLFEIGAFALKLDELRATTPDGKVLKPEQVAEGHQRGSADFKLTTPGVYRFALAGETVMAFYKEKGEQRRWRGSPADLKKEVPADAEDLRVSTTVNRLETYVMFGHADRTAFVPSGSGLELVPLGNPADLQIGEPARFRFLLDGKPLAGLKVAIVPGGVRYRGVLRETMATTDANGEFSVSWSMPQMYWINASYPPRAAGGPGAPGQAQPERRYNYGGTFEVLSQ